MLENLYLVLVCVFVHHRMYCIQWLHPAISRLNEELMTLCCQRQVPALLNGLSPANLFTLRTEYLLLCTVCLCLLKVQDTDLFEHQVLPVC